MIRNSLLFQRITGVWTKALTLLFSVLICSAGTLFAQTGIPNTTPVTQNFDAMGASTTLPVNWKMHASTASPNYGTAASVVTQQASSGSPSTGGTYNWGQNGATDRAIGAMTSGGFASPNNLLGYFRNTSANPMVSLTVSYQAERYRINSAAASVSFFYSTDGAAWTAVSAGDIAASSFPTGASSYTLSSPLVISVNSVVIAFPVEIAVSGDVYLRWNVNTTGSNSQGIGIDNISITGAFNTGGGPVVPTVSTAAVTGLSNSAAVSGGDVLSDGGATVTARGVAYATTMNPTILANLFTTDGSGTGAFVSNLSSLTANTLYYVRAYATNSEGTSYGAQQSFTTLKNAPTIQASNIIMQGGGSSMDVNWTNGNGDRRVVIMNTTNSFTNPVDGTDPSANAAYGGSGEQVVYNGTGNTFTVFGLTPATTYWLRVYSYNNTGAGTLYNTTTATDNPMMGNSGVFTCPTDLLFSEYVEGSSNNKYVEIYNGTGSSIDLSNYELRLYSNGSASPSSSSMTGILPTGQTIVYRHSSAVVYAGTATVSGAMNFNGDDAIAIWHIPSASFVDIFGTIGQDPGNAWTSTSNSTENKTLRRKSSVNAGVTVNPGPGFPTLEAQWTQFNIDDVSGLGSHTINACCFVASATSNSPLCSGSDLLLFAPTISGATYAWTGPGGYTSSDQNPVITGATSSNSGSYEVTINQPGGCPADMDAVVVTVSDPPTATVTEVDATCNGASDGSLTANPSGGIAPYTYAWDLNNPGGTTFIVMDDIKDPSHPSFGVGSSFGLVVDGVQGAELTLTRGITYTFDITAFGHPVYITTDADGGSTAGEITNGVTGSQTDFGFLTFTPNGSHPALLYYNCTSHPNMGWKLNIVNGPTGPTASSLAAGTYSVVVSDAIGCSVAAQGTVNEPAPVATPTITQNMPVCGDITLTSSASFGYLWSTGATTQSIVVSADGNYSVQAENASGCLSAPENSIVVINPCTPCVTPGSLSTSNVTAVSADFNWDPTVTGDLFTVRYWKDGDALPNGYRFFNVQGPNPPTTANISGLLPNTQYHIQVKTICTAGAYSSYSSLHSFSTINGTIPCIKPFDTRAINIGATSATVEWNQVVTADEFRVRYAPTAGGLPYNYSYKLVSGVPNVSSINITGLTSGTEYVFSIFSVCSGIKSRYSSNEVFTTIAPPAVNPVRQADTHLTAPLRMHIYPNPANDVANVEFETSTSENYNLVLSDLTGRTIQNVKGKTSSGSNYLQIDLSNIEKGIYLITIQLGPERISKRIVVQ